MLTELGVAEVALLRALAGPAVVLLLLLRLEQRASVRALADVLGMHEQTCARHLRTLAALGMAEHDAAGWQAARSPNLLALLESLRTPADAKISHTTAVIIDDSNHALVEESIITTTKTA